MFQVLWFRKEKVKSVGRMDPVACQDAGHRQFSHTRGWLALLLVELHILSTKGPWQRKGPLGAKVVL